MYKPRWVPQEQTEIGIFEMNFSNGKNRIIPFVRSGSHLLEE